MAVWIWNRYEIQEQIVTIEYIEYLMLDMS